jgi:hypothetical protein
MATVATIVRDRELARLTAPELIVAGQRLTDIGLDAGRHDRLAAEVLEVALDWLETRPPVPDGATVLGTSLTEQGVRGELERVYRAMARASHVPDERRALVDRANTVRPRTWV